MTHRNPQSEREPPLCAPASVCWESANAAPNTLRKLYAASIGENCTHGSDAPETAAQEIGYMFAGVCLV